MLWTLEATEKQHDQRLLPNKSNAADGRNLLDYRADGDDFQVDCCLSWLLCRRTNSSTRHSIIEPLGGSLTRFGSFL